MSLKKWLGWDVPQLSLIPDRLGPAQVRVKLFSDKAHPPERMSEGAAGYDVCACLGVVQVTLQPGERTTISLGFGLQMPFGVEAQLRSRSGLTDKHGIIVLNSPGTIDADYRGEIRAVMYNASQRRYTIKHGDRIAQLVFARVIAPEMPVVGTLKKTARGGKGFGSTGK